MSVSSLLGDDDGQLMIMYSASSTENTAGNTFIRVSGFGSTLSISSNVSTGVFLPGAS